MKINFINNINPKQNINKMYNTGCVAFSADSVPLCIIDETGHVSKYDSMKEVSIALGVSVETLKKAIEENRKVSGVTVKKAEDLKNKK